MLKLEAGLDECILGLVEGADSTFRLCYSADWIIDSLVVNKGMSYSQAEAHFNAHFLDLPGTTQSPLFLTQMGLEEIEALIEEANTPLKK